MVIPLFDSLCSGSRHKGGFERLEFSKTRNDTLTMDQRRGIISVSLYCNSLRSDHCTGILRHPKTKKLRLISDLVIHLLG